ncbi:MAG: FAD-dependent oxidoreductase, partial [Deltaproteobacteria bacterium]|nr:FAD-dependent oxidoreductase [Deltaproteobacteria bacterium]
GRKVLVIGGGNVAFDVARTSRRLGGDATIICLECEDKRSKDGIPADTEEIRGAWEEGIRIIYSRGVKKILGESERVKKIECPKCVNVFDSNGFNPQFDESDLLTLDGDILIITVGQGPDRASLQEEHLLDERGLLVLDSLTLQSLKREWVFIGGDLRKIGFMAEAMKDGLVAADSIERYLRVLDMKEGRKRDYQAQDIPRRRVYQSEPEVLWIPPEKRLHFQIFEKGFTLAEAIEESKRCLTCGPCLSCKACVSIGIQESLPMVEVKSDRCCGCGICVSICFYGSAMLRQYESKRISSTDMFTCKSCGMCVVACPSGARKLVGDPMENRIAEVFSALQAPLGA